MCVCVWSGKVYVCAMAVWCRGRGGGPISIWSKAYGEVCAIAVNLSGSFVCLRSRFLRCFIRFFYVQRPFDLNIYITKPRRRSKLPSIFIIIISFKMYFHFLRLKMKLRTLLYSYYYYYFYYYYCCCCSCCCCYQSY